MPGGGNLDIGDLHPRFSPPDMHSYRQPLNHWTRQGTMCAIPRSAGILSWLAGSGIRLQERAGTLGVCQSASAHLHLNLHATLSVVECTPRRPLPSIRKPEHVLVYSSLMTDHTPPPDPTPSSRRPPSPLKRLPCAHSLLHGCMVASLVPFSPTHVTRWLLRNALATFKFNGHTILLPE